jgi:ribonuclease T2
MPLASCERTGYSASTMKKMTAPALLILLLLTGCDPRPRPTPEPVPRPRAAAFAQQPSANQPFDYYLLNLSWSPEFCYSHRNAAECASHPAFVLHGLWPQNNDGTYPQNCANSSGPADPSQFSDIYPDSGLLQHEWRTHGTCSGLSPNAFFTTARAAFHQVAVPAKLSQLDQQISLPPAQIIDLFTDANPTIPRSSFALSCGNNYLTAIEVCLNKSGQPIDCGPIRSCRANTVRIPPP